MTVARRERAALVDTLRRVGPDAPTLCGGWDTRDLAAHLVIRERRLDAAPGIFIPLFADHTAKVQDSVTHRTGWEELVHKVAGGPPVYSPFKLLDPIVNIAEMFIHHEDVRRAQPGWNSRELEPALATALLRTLPLLGRLALKQVPNRVALQDNTGTPLFAVGRGQTVTVVGKPAELLLFAVGRQAQVDLDGDSAAVQAVRDAPKGL